MAKLDRRTQWKSWTSYQENLDFLNKYGLNRLHWKLLYWYDWLSVYGKAVAGIVWKAAGMDRKFYVKAFDSRRNLDADIATTRLIRSRTTIPVPLGLFQFRTWRYRYLIMERIPGISLHDAIQKLSVEDKERIIARLRDYMAQLRSIERPRSDTPSVIASISGGPIYCTRLHDYLELSGPFRDEEHMNTQIRCGQPIEEFAEPVPTVHRTSHSLVLTHNDFNARNIMVANTPGIGWQVSGIIDWECAGWLPDYWEYVKSLNVASWASLETKKSWDTAWLPMILDPFKVEADADRVFDRYPGMHIP